MIDCSGSNWFGGIETGLPDNALPNCRQQVPGIVDRADGCLGFQRRGQPVQHGRRLYSSVIQFNNSTITDIFVVLFLKLHFVN